MARDVATATASIQPPRSSLTAVNMDESEDAARPSVVQSWITGMEATELTRTRTQYSRATASYRSTSVRTNPRPTGAFARGRYELAKFWRSQISVIVAHDACRDHLALERTFLAYLRTSLAISMIGVTVAQLFRLQHAPTPNLFFGFYVLGKPLACICQGCAIYTLLLGFFRTWRHQHAIVRGKAIAGGFEVLLLGLGVLVILVLFFVLLIAVDITKED